MSSSITIQEAKMPDSKPPEIPAEEYQIYFTKLSRFVEFLKALAKEFPDDFPKPPEIMRQSRTAYADFFRNSDPAKNLCGTCGQCCYQDASPLTASDLLEALLLDPDFSLPRPDYQFLGEDNYQGHSTDTDRNYQSSGFKCVFLGPNGCQLKKDRPTVCYRYRCATLEKILMAAELKELDKSFGYPSGSGHARDEWDKWLDTISAKIRDLQIALKTEPDLKILQTFSKTEVAEFLKWCSDPHQLVTRFSAWLRRPDPPYYY